MDKTHADFEHHDVIWLQTGGEGYEDWETFEYEGVTWCQDKINRNDTKYLLATPERKAAAGLLKSCEELVQAMVDYQIDVETDPPRKHRIMMAEARENIAKAKETSDE